MSAFPSAAHSAAMNSTSPSVSLDAVAAAAVERNRYYHRAFLLATVVVLVLAALLEVEGQRYVALPLVHWRLPNLCTWQNMFGIDCPGCGLTRSFICLAHGQTALAWRYNPAGLLLFVLLLGQIPYRSLQLWRIARGLPELPWAGVGWWLLGAASLAMILQWLLRLTGVLP